MCASQCTVINKNENDKSRDNVIDKLQLDGDNVTTFIDIFVVLYLIS